MYRRRTWEFYQACLIIVVFLGLLDCASAILVDMWNELMGPGELALEIPNNHPFLVALGQAGNISEYPGMKSHGKLIAFFAFAIAGGFFTLEQAVDRIIAHLRFVVIKNGFFEVADPGGLAVRAKVERQLEEAKRSRVAARNRRVFNETLGRIRKYEFFFICLVFFS